MELVGDLGTGMHKARPMMCLTPHMPTHTHTHTSNIIRMNAPDVSDVSSDIWRKRMKKKAGKHVIVCLTFS